MSLNYYISLLWVCLNFLILAQENTVHALLSLEECQKLALEYSPTLKTEGNNLLKKELNYKFSKRYWHPSLSAYGSYNLNFGRRVDQFTNTFSNSIVHSNSWGASLNMSIFNGLRNKRTVEINNLTSLTQKAKIEENKITLKRKVTETYFLILEKQISVEISNLKIDDITNQVNRNNQLAQEGRSNRLDSLIFVNQQMTELANLNSVKQLLRKDILNLNLLINHPLLDTLVAKVPIVDLSKMNSFLLKDDASVFANEQLALQIKSAELELRKAKGSYSPTLSLSGSIGTGFSTNNLDYSVTPNELKPYGRQLNENLYESVGLNLSIPIYSKGENKRAVELAKINIENSKILKDDLLKTQEQQVQLRKFEFYYLIRNRDLIQEQNIRDLEIFNLTKELFEKGRINQFEYEVARNKYFQSKLNLKMIHLSLSKIVTLYH